MLIAESVADVPMISGEMRLHIFKPAGSGFKLPCLLLFSEIYQVTGPIARLARRLASEGYIVAAPEVYHEYLPAGTSLNYNAMDTDTGNRLKTTKKCVEFDNDAAAAIEFLIRFPDSNGAIGVIGMCLGGHLALRAAFHPKVLAGVCLFATDVHSGTLGAGGDDSLSRLNEIGDSEMLFVFGKQDTHVPFSGRDIIRSALEIANVGFSWFEMNAHHAFIRDELSKGRYDASLANICFVAASELFHRRLILGMPQQREVVPDPSIPGPNC